MIRGAFILALLSIECTPEVCNPIRWGYSIAHGQTYDVAATKQTPDGIRYDGAVTPELIDRLTKEVSECLKTSIDRSSFILKVPSDIVMSCDGSQQELSAIAPMSGCDAKGLKNTCQCHWRALIQCPNTIVATPSLYLYKDALVRFVTGSADPWNDPELARCATPSTSP